MVGLPVIVLPSTGLPAGAPDQYLANMQPQLLPVSGGDVSLGLAGQLAIWNPELPFVMSA